MWEGFWEGRGRRGGSAINARDGRKKKKQEKFAGGGGLEKESEESAG